MQKQKPVEEFLEAIKERASRRFKTTFFELEKESRLSPHLYLVWVGSAELDGGQSWTVKDHCEVLFYKVTMSEDSGKRGLLPQQMPLNKTPGVDKIHLGKPLGCWTVSR